jgi:methionyl-tRNA formyltransferase
MNKTSKTVVFFGSGPVAAKALELLAQNFSIEAVITKPKPVHHKGSFPVIEVAEQLKVPLITAGSNQELSQVITQQQFESRLAVLIDFGIIVAQDVIDTFPLGIVNSHFSLLPEWRGADPITFAILSGQKQTGVSLMLLVEAMDEGPLLAQAPFELSEHITAPELTAALIELSNHQLQAVLPLYLEGKALSVSQEQAALPGHDTPSYSRKLTKDDSILDWHKPAEQLEREIRAFIEWPKSQTTIGAQQVIITKAHIEAGSGEPGTLWKQPKKLGYYTAHDILVIDNLKPAGKGEMTVEAFLAGYGSKLGL